MRRGHAAEPDSNLSRTLVLRRIRMMESGQAAACSQHPASLLCNCRLAVHVLMWRAHGRSTDMTLLSSISISGETESVSIVDMPVVALSGDADSAAAKP